MINVENERTGGGTFWNGFRTIGGMYKINGGHKFLREQIFMSVFARWQNTIQCV